MTCADCGEASSRSCLYSPESRISESVCRSCSRTVPYISDLRPIEDYLARDGIIRRNDRGNNAGVDRADTGRGAHHHQLAPAKWHQALAVPVRISVWCRLS